ncbi:MAG: hypothetical protein HC774_04820 [Sphingomonadales bacterium]|nr:hypothetical protein [Sphingomonadales bacterium]
MTVAATFPERIRRSSSRTPGVARLEELARALEELPDVSVRLYEPAGLPNWDR